MKMPTTTNSKVEAKLASPELGDAAKQCINCLEKKVRNLEKRKSRIEQNQEKAKKGTKLEKEQEVSLNQYDQVTHDLEFARELHKQFLQIYTEHEKMSKKQAKREKAERQAIEIKRISEILQLQSLLDSLGGDKVREDFKTGKHGAVVLTEDNLNQLDELYQAISPTRDDSGNDYAQKLTTAAEHLVNILEGKDRQVVGTTYKEIKELITLINGCGYFERANKAGSDVVAESSVENEEFEDATGEPVDSLPIDSENDLVPDQQTQQQPIDLTMGNNDGIQPQRDHPTQPLNTLEQDAFFAPSSTPYQADTDSQFSQQSHTSVSRITDFQSFTNNRPFQFIQTSYVMPDSVAADPAVIAAQPAGASGLQFMSSGFDPVTTQIPKSADLSHSSSSMQQHQQSALQSQQTQDFNSQNYTQSGLQNDGIYAAPGMDDTNQLTHPVIMGHIGEDGVATYEIPPTIPMPSSQTQVATGSAVPASTAQPVVDQPVPPSGSAEFTNTPAASGDFGQQGSEFSQNFQGNNGFQSYRGNRSGYRGNRGGGNGSSNRAAAAGGSPVQNGFGGRGGGANTNNSRGGRGGSFQNYQSGSGSNYRSDNFQSGYNSGNFAGGTFQKRGGQNSTGGQSSYTRGGSGASGTTGRGSSNGGRGGNNMSRGGTGSGAARGSARGFSRPMPAQ
ncbi:caprin-1-like isoform X2 [Physella acuta]|uniref:caprin-1-like isoform X2 n=1 Tax=Physella acuta TaxID=109671 RepID=UPI0027DE1487|nr:caprin-1-like isoform X2 [Physella acuta]